MREFHDNHESMAKAMEAATLKYDLDGIFLDVDTALLASACGACVAHPEDAPAVTKGDQPRSIEPLVMAAIAFFAFTLGPVVWVLLSELFPVRVRGTAMSIAVAALWTSSYGLLLTFPPINLAFGTAGTFWLYGAICVIGFAVCACFLHETKGKELD